MQEFRKMHWQSSNIVAISIICLCGTYGCKNEMDPTRLIVPNALDMKEIRNTKKIAIIPINGDFTVWNQRGRIKAVGGIGAGAIAGGIGFGAIAAAGTTTTATGATVIAMSAATAAATAGVAVVAAGAWLAIDASIRDATDKNLEKAMFSSLVFRPECAICQGMKEELSARYGVEVVNAKDLSQNPNIDVLVLVRTWRYGLFRIYTKEKGEKPLRPFCMVSVHVLKPNTLDSETLKILEELANEEKSVNSKPMNMFMDNHEIWFHEKLGSSMAVWQRFLVSQLPLPDNKKDLEQETEKIKNVTQAMAEQMGKYYGFHVALAMR